MGQRERLTQAFRDLRFSAGASILAALGLFALVVALRWRGGFSNVDDYLYALQTLQYRDALGLGPGPLLDAWRAFGTNSPLVPMLALPIAAISTSPHALVLVQALPLLVLLGSCRSLLVDLRLGSRTSWWVAAGIATLAPVLSYAAMYHFAVAATACTALAAAAYARSDRLERVNPSLVFGLALGLLSLTRVVAPVYVAAICAAVFVDVLVDRSDRARRIRNAAWALLVAVLVAAPWWLATGRIAFDYLVSAGYGDSPFTTQGSRIDILFDRFRWTGDETGWVIAVPLLALVGWALVCARRGAPGARVMTWLIATSVLGMLFLGSSSNLGTAFALPFVVLATCAAAAALSHLPGKARAAVGTGCCAALVASALAVLGVIPAASYEGRPLWQAKTPGIAQAQVALGCRCDLPDTGRLNRRVLDAIDVKPTLIAREDAVLNAQSLRYTAAVRETSADLRASPDGRTVSPRQLSEVRYVIAGTTPAPYQGGIDQLRLRSMLRGARFRLVLDRRLSAANRLTVWVAPGTARGRRRTLTPDGGTDDAK